MRVNLERIIKNKGFNENVKFLGNIKHVEVHELYKIADIYTITSFFEGTPISLLEAMFNRLPIIGSDVSGINNIITDCENGLLFENKNTKDLAEKIKLMIDNDELTQKLASKAKQDYLDNFKFDEVVLKHEKIFSIYEGFYEQLFCTRSNVP